MNIALRLLLTICPLALSCGGCGGSSLPPPRTSSESQAVADSPVVAPPAPQVIETTEGGPSAPPAVAKTESPGDTTNGSQRAGYQTRGSEGLSRQQRFDRSVENLQRIGEAIGVYVDEQGHFPHRDMDGADFQFRKHGWRVGLLPYLDENELYRRCELKEYWNSPENRHMLNSIPEVFRSNASDKTKCNYLFVVGRGTCFAVSKSPGPDKFADGIQNTILLVEVNDEFGVPWTSPNEIELQDVLNHHLTAQFIQLITYRS